MDRAKDRTLLRSRIARYFACTHEVQSTCTALRHDAVRTMDQITASLSDLIQAVNCRTDKNRLAGIR